MSQDRRTWAETWANGAQLDEAVREAVRDAVREHRVRRNPIAVWEDDRVRIVDPKEIRDPEAFETLFLPVGPAELTEVAESDWSRLPAARVEPILDDVDLALELARGLLDRDDTGHHAYLLAFEVPREHADERLELADSAVVGRIRIIAEFSRDLT